MQHATIDFETYSEAGFVFNKAAKKWEGLLNASKKGLPCVGTAVYAKHASTRILSLAYKLPGQDVKVVMPKEGYLPKDLCDFLLEGGIFEAWNVSFERWIWEEVAVKLYFWPPIEPDRWRCAAAKSRAFAMPNSLADAGRVLKCNIQKDADGKRLLTKFSMPRNPTAKDSRLRVMVQDDPKDAQLLYNYNKRDVEAEIELSNLMPELSPFELKFWQCDQEINHRGVQIDTVSVLQCIHIIQQAHEKYNKELPALTNGAVTASSQIDRISSWMKSLGVHTDSLDKEHTTELLKNPLLLPQVRRVLEIRQLIGSAAVKKLYAMLNSVTTEGRVHDLFVYHSARTGRAAGEGVQPQNLPRGQEGFDVEKALGVISSGKLDIVEAAYGNAVNAVSNCLRGMFIAKRGHMLIASDYSAIEAVVLAELAGEKWRQDVFRTHGKIYEMSGSVISGVSFEEMLEYKERTGKHHEARKLGKVAELACFAPDTQVLTDSGYRRIVDVSLNDKLWDGIQWVTHGGLIAKGERMTLNLDGVRMTPNHPISLGHCWKEAKLLALNKNTLIQALAIGSVNLPIKATEEEAKKGIGSHFVNVLAEISQRLRIVISEIKDQPGVIYVLKRLQKTRLLNGLNNIGHMKTLSQNPKTDAGYVRDYRLQSDVAIKKIIKCIPTMEDGELRYVMNGAVALENFSNMSPHYPDGITKCLKWIASIITKGMNRATLDLYREQKTRSINEAFKKCSDESMTLSPVYDIVNAGANHRFTIKTDSGHLIVHNSGYGGWLSAWHNFGAGEFMDDEAIKSAILAWRDASPAIVEFWGGQQRWGEGLGYYGVEGASIQAVLYPGQTFAVRGSPIAFNVYNDALYCSLPSGRKLTYHAPRLEMSSRRPGTYELSYEGWNSNPKNGKPGWIRQSTYGGKLVENITQAVARDILAHAIVNLENQGYHVVLHVHDEIVCEVKKTSFRSVLAQMENIMSTMPTWAKGWPVVAKGGWIGERYCK